MTSAPAIGFEYRPSPWPLRITRVMAALALLSVWLSAAPVWLALPASIGLLLALRHSQRRWRVPISAAGWSGHAGWSLRGADGGDHPAELLASRVLGEAILLHLRCARYGRLSLWLLPDNSDADLRRRLRMRLALAVSAGEEATA